VVFAVAAGAYFIGHRADPETAPLAVPVAASLDAAPGPAEFAHELAGLANQFSAQTGDDGRLTQVDSFRITLSSRTGRCGSLREAVQSLQ